MSGNVVSTNSRVSRRNPIGRIRVAATSYGDPSQRLDWHGISLVRYLKHRHRMPDISPKQ